MERNSTCLGSMKGKRNDMGQKETIRAGLILVEELERIKRELQQGDTVTRIEGGEQ